MTNSFVFLTFVMLSFALCLSEQKIQRISTLVDRKSFSIPLKTKFILKCSTTTLSNSNGDNGDDQLDDEQPELIVLNNLEQIKKLVNHFNKLRNEKADTKIETIGWNKTALSRLYSSDRHSTHKSSKTGRNSPPKLQNRKSSSSTDKPSDKAIESMFRSGKAFFRPTENVSLFANGQACLMFTSFSQNDESIYSCFYKPKLDSWSNLFDFSRLNSWIDSINDVNDLNGLNSFINNKKFKDFNLVDNVPLLEKLLYLTCTLTWPFNQECHLVKQFKLTVDKRSDDSSFDYWKNLDFHDRLRLKKLFKELMKYCHPASSSSSFSAYATGNQKRKTQSYGNKKETNFIIDLFSLLFNDLFLNIFCDLIKTISSSLFDYLFSSLFGSGIYNFFSDTICELFNELINDLFVDSFKELNLLYLIYIVFIIFIYFSLNSSRDSSEEQPRKTFKINDRFLDSRDGQESNLLDSTDDRTDADLHKRDKIQPMNRRKTSIKQAPKRRDKNLKFKIDTSITNRAGKKSLKSKLRNQVKDKLRDRIDSTGTTPFFVTGRNAGEHDTLIGEKLKILFQSKPFRDDKPRNDLIRRGKCNELGKLKEFRAGRPISSSKDEIDYLEDLELEGEIVISKLGEVSYLSKFLFKIPKELEDEQKPLHLILDTGDSKEQSRITSLDRKASSNEIATKTNSDEIDRGSDRMVDDQADDENYENSGDPIENDEKDLQITNEDVHSETSFSHDFSHSYKSL